MSTSMTVRFGTKLSHDIILLVFEQLGNDSTTMADACRVSHEWHDLLLPLLLREVNLSSHNNGRVPDREDTIFPEIYADWSDMFRKQNLVSRQRAFLRTITRRPDYARFVRSFIWTLVWKDFDDEELTDIDYETWNVFSRLTAVRRLDLASLHDLPEERGIRQNPVRLFPSVTDLRLLGWMHRGLVDAILTSLDTMQLRSLKLDYLLDEGVSLGDLPMSNAIASKYAPTHDRLSARAVIDDELFKRQRNGTACIFPGPMWTPLRSLASTSLGALASLQIKLDCFNTHVDVRNYTTFYREVGRFLCHIKHTWEVLTIVFGENPKLFLSQRPVNYCATSWYRIRGRYRQECVEQAAEFLDQILRALNMVEYPRLTRLDFRGFRLLHDEESAKKFLRNASGVWQSLRACRFKNVNFTEIAALDSRWSWNGYEYNGIDEKEFVEILKNN